MRKLIYICLVPATFATADPIPLHPVLSLPYGIYQPTYRESSEIYVFKNVRYAAPPTGSLRWAKPTAPSPTMGKTPASENGSYGPQCIQASLPKGSFVDGLFPGVDRVQGDDLSGLFGNASAQSEDCLFLDVYVPRKIFQSPKNAPVLFYAHGGYFVSGSKDSPYTGFPIIEASNNNVIFVSANYRLGALGFLGGSSIEKSGTANAGIHDLRFALKWVHDNIRQVRGDPESVTYWGSDASAASALYMVTAYGGTQDPLFKRAILQSITHQNKYNRTNGLEEMTKAVAKGVGCNGGGSELIACMRKADGRVLAAVNSEITGSAPPGTFPFGPAFDGSLNERTLGFEMSEGKFWKGFDAMLLTHASHEATRFVQQTIDPQTNFSQYVERVYPEPLYKCFRDQIPQRYHPKSPSIGARKMATTADRITAYLEDGVFGISWIRALVDMYSSRGIFHHPKDDGEPFTTNVYAGVTDFGGGVHGSDIVLGFYQKNTTFGSLVERAYPTAPALADKWQAYLAGFVLAGDPNALKAPGTPMWPEAVAGLPPLDALYRTLTVQDRGFSIRTDAQARLQVLLDSLFAFTVTYLPVVADASCVDKEYGYFSADPSKLRPELLGRSISGSLLSLLRLDRQIA